MWTGTLRVEEGGKAEHRQPSKLVFSAVQMRKPAQRGGVTSQPETRFPSGHVVSYTRTAAGHCAVRDADVQACPIAPVRWDPASQALTLQDPQRTGS